MSVTATTNLTQIILVGAGDTNCTPSTTCLLSSSPCKNCIDSQKDTDNINNRHQSSILLQFNNGKSILVDCGLTFRNSVLKSVKKQTFQFPLICGFIATRNCPDAILGADDIREVTQRGEKITFAAPSGVSATMTRMFPYIMPSKSGKSENQKNLWTAGLCPLEKALRQGEKLLIPVGSGGGEIEIVGVGRSEKDSRENCGFVISLEEDGKLIYPATLVPSRDEDENSENTNQTKKSKVALYLPFDCLSPIAVSNRRGDDELRNQQHYSTSTVDVLRHFDIELAVIACPSPSSQTAAIVSEVETRKRISDLISANWKELLVIKKIVVCSIPHNVVVHQDVTAKRNDDHLEGDDTDNRSNISFGSDSEIIWQRPDHSMKQHKSSI